MLNNIGRLKHATKNKSNIRQAANLTHLEPDVKPITKLPAKARFAPMMMDDYNVQIQSRQLPTFDR